MEAKLKNAENIFMTCKSNSYGHSDNCNSSTSGHSSSEDDDVDIANNDDEDLMVSLINQKGDRLVNPIKSVHCKHRSCFEAVDFFDENATVKIWHCPICKVHIKGFEVR